MSIVSKTGPLMALAKMDQLALLAIMFGTVQIPPAVHRELLGNYGPEAGRLDQALANWLAVTERLEPSPQTDSTPQAIDAGRREAITLAQLMQLPLLIDDQLGRQAARHLGLFVTGTVGIIIEAKRGGLFSNVRPLLEDMQAQGY